MKASIYTLGCRVNQYESEAISEALVRKGFEIVEFGEECDITIINSCTVTAESDRKSKQFTRKAIKVSPNGKIIMTGCFADASPKEAGKTGAIIVSNKDKNKIADLAYSLITNTNCETDNMLTVSIPKRARTFVKIEDGCENHCAYCLIKKARGNVVSKDPNEVISEIKTIVENGCHEIILTGIETASYGKDLSGTSLLDLMKKVNEIPGVERFTLGSLDPSVMTDKFVNEIKEMDKLLPHFHLSIQSGSTKVLNKMRRKYSAEMALNNINRLKDNIKDVTLSADIIVGFPNESEDDFMDTYNFCKEVEFLHLHIFPYSRRKGTEADLFDNQIPEDIKRIRASKLNDLRLNIQEKIINKYIESHDKNNPIYVLVEQWKNGYSNGHSEHFIECNIPTNCDMTGKILEVIPTSYSDGMLVCKINK